MKPQKVFNNLEQGSKDITEALSAVNDPECQLNSRDLLNVFKKNLEVLRDNYLQLTEAEFYFEVSKAPEQTKHRLKSADPLNVDCISRDALLNDYEANLKQWREVYKLIELLLPSRQDLLSRHSQKTMYKQYQAGIDSWTTYWIFVVN